MLKFLFILLMKKICYIDCNLQDIVCHIGSLGFQIEQVLILHTTYFGAKFWYFLLFLFECTFLSRLKLCYTHLNKTETGYKSDYF
jgi:hypothetical protein